MAMSGTRLWISSLAALFVSAAGAAQAADYSPPLPPPPPCCDSWYLRGNIGFSNQQLGSLSNANYALANSVTNTDRGFDAAPFFALGVGYTVNNWLRLDVTGEYRGNATFHGMDIATDSTGIHDDNYSGSKSEWTFLFNGYVDLGTWYCLTPFIGAGVGVSGNTISNFRDWGMQTGADVYADAATKWNFAWALYAGLGYQVTKNFTVEFTYRYLDLGDATTGAIHSYAGNSDPSYTPFAFNHLTSHDLMLGLRWTCCEVPAEAPPPRYVYTPPPPVYAPPPPLRSRG
jgi:opacity protein-like surface antigen